MKVTYSKNILFLSDNAAFEAQIQDFVKSKSLSVFDDELLHSTKKIKEKLSQNKNLAFLREKIVEEIKNNGAFYFIIIDFATDFEPHTSDRHYLLKMTLLTYILLSLYRDYENIIANLIILYDSSSQQVVDSLLKDPQYILSILKTGNSKIDKRIEYLAKNKKAFKSLFFINYISVDSNDVTINNAFSSSYQLISSRIKLKNKYIMTDLSKVSNVEGEAASVLFKSDEKNVYINGLCYEDASDINLKENCFYIKGLWSSATNKSVAENLKKSIAVQKKIRTPSSGIVVFLDNDCIIDGAIAPSIAQIIVSDLSKIKFKVMVSKANYNILNNSTGFSMIKKYVFQI